MSFVHCVEDEKSTLVTFEVLKKFGPRMREVRLEHKSNIEAIFVTAEVSRPVRSREVRPEQKANIAAIFVTAEVLKPERSREVRPEQEVNI